MLVYKSQTCHATLISTLIFSIKQQLTILIAQLFDDTDDGTHCPSLHCLEDNEVTMCIAVSPVKQDWVMTGIQVGPPLVGYIY